VRSDPIYCNRTNPLRPGRNAWPVEGIFARRYSNDNQLGLGFRVWEINYSKDKGLMDSYTSLKATFYGLMIGYDFN